MKEIIYTKNAPEPVGPYSQAIKVNGFLYCSGQIAIDPKNNQFIDGNIEEQTLQVMKNIEAVLNEAGYSFDDVIKTMYDPLQYAIDFLVDKQIAKTK